MSIPPPAVLKTPLKVPAKLLMGPGPSNCSPRVLHAMSQPTLGHMHPETLKMMDEIKEGIKYVFQTRNTLTLAVSASGHGGMEAVLCNLLEPGDVALIASNTFWGQRAAEMARRYGATAKVLQSAPGKPFTDEEIERAIVEHKAKLVFIVQGDSTTGVLQPLNTLGHVCHRNRALLVVDTVASLGGTEFRADDWGIDAAYTGSQKVLGAPAGITPVTFSPLAEEVIFKRKTPVKVYYWDMTTLGDYWNCFNRPRIYHHTISLPLVYGLREALAQIVEEGLENVTRRHRIASQRFYDGLRRLGLELYVENPEHRLPTVTTVRVNSRFDWSKVVAFAMKNYLVEISGGLGNTANQVFRIGLMGHNATEENVDLVLKIFREALQEQGVVLSRL